MKKNIFKLSIMICFIVAIFITMAISLENDLNDKDNKFYQDKETLDREKFKSFYIEGPFNEELYEIQESLGSDEIYYKVIKSKYGFDEEVEKYNLDTPRMEYSLNYTLEYFENRAILLVYPKQGPSNISYTVKEVKEYIDEVYVLIEKYIPSVIREDMINHGLLIEIHGQSSDNPINIKVQEVHPPNN